METSEHIRQLRDALHRVHHGLPSELRPDALAICLRLTGLARRARQSEQVASHSEFQTDSRPASQLAASPHAQARRFDQDGRACHRGVYLD